MIDEVYNSEIFKEVIQQIVSSNEEIDKHAGFVLDTLIEEVIVGLCFDVHRAVKLGIFYIGDMDEESEKKYEIVDELGLDVFGQVPTKKQYECVCPNCQRSLAAPRFAPHLEKCMGMGRNSSRIASKRIASSGKDFISEDDENDDDWTYQSDKKVSKKKKVKHDCSPRRTKSGKVKNGEPGNLHDNPSPSCETMSVENKKALLKQMCGVISEHTKKMCTRSHRCPQHTDDQRRQVRDVLLGQHSNSSSSTSGSCDTHMDSSDDIHIDIDTYDDGEAVAIRDTLQQLAQNNGAMDANSSVTKRLEPRKPTVAKLPYQRVVNKKQTTFSEPYPPTTSYTVSKAKIEDAYSPKI